VSGADKPTGPAPIVAVEPGKPVQGGSSIWVETPVAKCACERCAGRGGAPGMIPYLRTMPSGRVELVCPVDAPPWHRWWIASGLTVHDELMRLAAPYGLHRDYCGNHNGCEIAPDRRGA